MYPVLPKFNISAFVGKDDSPFTENFKILVSIFFFLDGQAQTSNAYTGRSCLSQVWNKVLH